MKSSHGKNSVEVTVSCNYTAASRTQTGLLDRDAREMGTGSKHPFIPRVTGVLLRSFQKYSSSREAPNKVPSTPAGLVLICCCFSASIYLFVGEGHACFRMPAGGVPSLSHLEHRS